MQLETELLSLPVGHDVHVGLLAGPDLVAEGGQRVAGAQGLQGEVVVAGVGQSVAVILLAALVRKQAVKRFTLFCI